MRIYVNDKMQKGYFYDAIVPMGKDFAEDFKPELTPKEMLELGVFEGKYLTDCQNEFPKDWFSHAVLSPQKSDAEKNYFHVKSRMSLKEWQKKGWIIGPDVRGWFQWYCRYYMGRRIPYIDRIQINRWKSYKRHKAQLEKNCWVGDLSCRIKQRQSLLQWAYNPFL